MGYKKPMETTRTYLENAPLPNHGKSYTVVTHKSVIDNTLSLLRTSGFTVTEERYKCNVNANVAQGIYYIRPNSTDTQVNNEEELGMMFAWTNSYDKSTRFQCSIGAYVKICGNGMVAGDMYNFKRKHTGSADLDIRNQLSNQIKNAEKYYKRLISDKELMKVIKLNCQQQSELAGRLFIEEDMLDSQQMTCVKAEMDKPSFNYNCGDQTAWAFYNHVTHALKKAHPRDWLADQQNFHDFMTAECLNHTALQFGKTDWKVNYDNTPLGITNADDETCINTNIEVDTTVDMPQIEVDFDISPAKLKQDMFMGR